MSETQLKLDRTEISTLSYVEMCGFTLKDTKALVEFGEVLPVRRSKRGICYGNVTGCLSQPVLCLND